VRVQLSGLTVPGGMTSALHPAKEQSDPDIFLAQGIIVEQGEPLRIRLNQETLADSANSDTKAIIRPRLQRV